MVTGEGEMELRRIQTNDTELNVALDGAGPPVLLMHGWPHTWQVWRPVLPLLTSQRRVIAPDLRGLGDSADAADGFDAATGADDMLGLLDALGVDRADVVALDAGVPAAFLLGVRHPTRVRRLVLMEAVLPACRAVSPRRRGGSASTPPPAWPRRCWKVTRAHTWNWFSHGGDLRAPGMPPEIRRRVRQRVHRPRGAAPRIRLLPGGGAERDSDPRGGTADRADPRRRRQHCRRPPAPPVGPGQRRAGGNARRAQWPSRPAGPSRRRRRADPRVPRRQRHRAPRRSLPAVGPLARTAAATPRARRCPVPRPPPGRRPPAPRRGCGLPSAMSRRVDRRSSGTTFNVLVK